MLHFYMHRFSCTMKGGACTMKQIMYFISCEWVPHLADKVNLNINHTDPPGCGRSPEQNEIWRSELRSRMVELEFVPLSYTWYSLGKQLNYIKNCHNSYLASGPAGSKDNRERNLVWRVCSDWTLKIRGSCLITNGSIVLDGGSKYK